MTAPELVNEHVEGKELGVVKKANHTKPDLKMIIHNGTQFRTADGVHYVRTVDNHTIYRAIPKSRGKSARRADKRARRMKHG